MMMDIIRQQKSYIEHYCPNCKEKLRYAYLSPMLMCCLKCNIVWELHWRKSKLSIEQVKKDGWLKHIDKKSLKDDKNVCKN